MTSEQDRGVQISAGDGIVAHFGNLTAYAVGETSRLNELLVRLSALADSSWQNTVRTITAGIAEAGYDDHPSIACVSMEPEKLAAFVYGPLELTAKIGGGTTVLDGRDSSTWIDVVLRGDVEQVHAGSRAEASLVGLLRDGVVPAGGFLLQTTGPIPSTSQWDAAMGAIADSTVAQSLATSASNTNDEEDVAAPVDTASNDASDDTDDTRETTDDETPDVQAEASTSEQDDVEEADQDATVSADEKPTAGMSGMAGMFVKIEQLSREKTDDLMAGIEHSADLDATSDFDLDDPDFDPEFDDPDFNEFEIQALDDTDVDDDDSDSDSSSDDVSADDDLPSVSSDSYSPFDDHPMPSSSSSGTSKKSSKGSTATIRKPRPELRGVHCPSGHFTPLEQSCRTCGVALDSGVTLTGAPRPVLGHLVFDDGAVLNIDRPAVVGSKVPNDYSINGEPTTIVRLDDGNGGVSPVQLEVRASGWNVEIVDMSSASGTYTMLREERHSRTRLRAGQAVTLQDGMTVEAGTRTFKFGTGPHAD